MLSRGTPGGLTVEIDNEPLKLGPVGQRVRVVDYDGVAGCYYEPVDLDDPAILMQGGLKPTEGDPRFHQQMVYAVTMRVLENFDRALGRKVSFRGKPLTLIPHAFRGPNAFFDPKMRAVCFGYFPADADRPGPNIPGQPIFSCLSHDIIAHEVTHAIVHRLRAHFTERTNVDVLAFHEGFSDIIAIFQHFTFPSVLHDAIRRSRGNLQEHTALAELAAQFGHGTARGGALRSAINDPDPSRYLLEQEPHARGSILVSAVFAGFIGIFERRSRALLRLATRGSGVLPEGDLAPDLVEQLAAEAAEAAQDVLTMCIRAFEYLPPIDVTFGDFLRALVTADLDLRAEEGAVERGLLIEAFRERGIYAEGVSSLAEDALPWPSAPETLPPMPAEEVRDQVFEDATQLDRRTRSAVDGNVAAGALTTWAKANAAALGLDPSEGISLQGFHATFRVAPGGELRVEVVAQFMQKRSAPELHGGSTVIATSDGTVRFVVAKPVNDAARVARQQAFLRSLDASDPLQAWSPGDANPRVTGRTLRALHNATGPR